MIELRMIPNVQMDECACFPATFAQLLYESFSPVRIE